jgi:hypothetical protein
MYLEIFLLVYGVIKFILGLLALTLPVPYREKLQDVAVVSDFITMDITAAGKAIDIAILIFSSYAILKSVFNLLKKKTVIQSPNTVYVLYGTLGTFLLLFYLLVISTDFISKDKEETGTYQLSGIGSGLCFLITSIIIYLWHYHSILRSIHIATLSILTVVFVTSLIYVIYLNVDRITKKRNEIVTVMMMPFGAL